MRDVGELPAAPGGHGGRGSGAAGQLSMTPSGEQAITGNCDPRKAPRLLNTVRRSRPNKEVRTYMLNKHGCHVSCTLTSVHLTVSVNRKVIFPHAVSVCAVIPPPVFARPPPPPPLTVSMTLCVCNCPEEIHKHYCTRREQLAPGSRAEDEGRGLKLVVVGLMAVCGGE